MAVAVYDKNHEPLMPCSERRARILLQRGRARIHCMRPFGIRLVDRLANDSQHQPLVVKIDPGSRTTGIAIVRVQPGGSHAALSLIELQHRGNAIRKALLARRAHRRFRRSRLRFRPVRFDNRTKPAGWLPPSLQHRVDTTMSWLERLRRSMPITGIAVERVRFDTQLMRDPHISGIGYQNGTLAGTEVREYLLEKWDRTCAYCDATKVPLEVEHIVARSQGGGDGVSNLTLACVPCNRAKGSMPVQTFVTDRERLTRILSQARAPLRDAAAVNITRNVLYQDLVMTGLPVEASTGGRTKWNRVRFGVPKSHALDAACVGECAGVADWRRTTLAVTATGRGSYQRTRLTAHGFPRGYLMRTKRAHGFATGDLVRANVPKGKNAGTHTGRVAVRAVGNFNIDVGQAVVRDVSHRHCRLLQRADGYAYATIAQQQKKGVCSSTT